MKLPLLLSTLLLLAGACGDADGDGASPASTTRTAVTTTSVTTAAPTTIAAMTGTTTAAGAVPLILSSGAGAETRLVIGVVVLAGVLSATLFTLFVVPVAYSLLARKTNTPGARSRRLEQEQKRLQTNGA